MRLIDADALIGKFNEKVDMAECLVNERSAERFATFCALADAVEEMPTVDAEVVVRCKDCKYRDGTLGQPNILCAQMHEDDFCSYGECREDKDG